MVWNPLKNMSSSIGMIRLFPIYGKIIQWCSSHHQPEIYIYINPNKSPFSYGFPMIFMFQTTTNLIPFSSPWGHPWHRRATLGSRWPRPQLRRPRNARRGRATRAPADPWAPRWTRRDGPCLEAMAVCGIEMEAYIWLWFKIIYPKMDGFPTKHDHFCGSLVP